jgi:hypothetical protein
MQIFNIQLNGEDAKLFCKQDVEFKVRWIKAHTNQQNDEQIMEWINSPKTDGDCGCGCGGHKTNSEIKTTNTPKKKFGN